MGLDDLPAMTVVPAVVAHPDDESFALGAVIGELAAHRRRPPQPSAVFDPDGVTGHADNQRAGQAVLAAVNVAALPAVLAWSVPQRWPSS